MSKINKTIVFLCFSALFGGGVYAMESGEASEGKRDIADLYVGLVSQAQEKMRDIVRFINFFSVVEPAEIVSDDQSPQDAFKLELAGKLELLEALFDGPLLSAWFALKLSDKYQRTVYEAADQLSQSWLNFLWELPSGVEQRRFERAGMPFVLPEVVEVLTRSAQLCKRHKYGSYIKELKTLKDNLEERCLTAADRVVAVNVVDDYIEFARTKKRQLQRPRRANRAKHKAHEAPL